MSQPPSANQRNFTSDCPYRARSRCRGAHCHWRKTTAAWTQDHCNYSLLNVFELIADDLQLPISELHFNNEAWGKNADSFAPNRFVENPKLAKSLAFRPFGGGTTQCPGRFYARRAISAFIALLVSRYELEAESESFPTADPSRPSPGAILMGEDQDVKLRCTPRKQ